MKRHPWVLGLALCSTPLCFAGGKLIDSGRADLNGDGKVEPVEVMAFELVLKDLRSPTFLLHVVQRFSASNGRKVVDLSEIFLHPTPSSGGGQAQALEGCTPFIRGDVATPLGTLDISDAAFLLSWLFVGGPAPSNLDAADANDSGTHNLTDPIRILLFLFLGGAAPPHPFPNPGLDPTPDAFAPECTPSYAEFNPFYAEKDVTGDGVSDPLYITTFREIELYPLDSAQEKQLYAMETFPPAEDDNLMLPMRFTLLAAADNGVVYALTNKNRIYAYKDTSGDGLRDVTQSFLAPSPPVDAALIFTDDGQGLVTLHNEGGSGTLYLWLDSDADGFIDAGSQSTLATEVTLNPQGLAVDRNTGRLFVAGENFQESEIVVLLDSDADRIADEVQAAPYMVEADASSLFAGAPQTTYLPLHFEPESRRLLVLTGVAASPARTAIVCAAETGGAQTQPSSVGIFQDPVNASHAIYARRKDPSTIVVWVSDDFYATSEYEGPSPACTSTGIAKLIARSSASRRSALSPDFFICTVVFTAPAQLGINVVQFFQPPVTGNPGGAPQIYDLTATQPNPGCLGNLTPGIANTVTTQNGTGFVDWGIAGTPVSPTELRGRIITNWESAPGAGSCCGGLRSSRYQYDSGAMLFPNAAGACNVANLSVPSDLIPGGRFREDNGCYWDLSAGKPVDSFAGVWTLWTRVFGGAQINCFAPFPFTFSITQLENRVDREAGGRSDGEGTYQQIFLEVDCKL